jgi:hypothetical protein
MLKKIEPYESHYSFFLGKFGKDEFSEEDVKIIQGNGNGTDIKVDLFAERWRSPETTIKILKELQKVIEENFIRLT